MFETIVKELTVKVKTEKLNLKDILNLLFDNEELKNKYVNEIRRSTIIGQIANKIIRKSKLKEECKIMAIGDIKYFKKHEKKWEKFVKKSLKSIDVSKLGGYDLSGQGSTNLRETLYTYMDNYYNYSGLNKDLIIDSIIPTYGCTDGFVSLIDTIKTNYKNINFIYPEASFMANVKIAENILGKNKVLKIDKPKTNNFFISENQIEEIYNKKLKPNSTNIFYFTPVGNPTGEKINTSLLTRIIKKILTKDQNSIIIFDNVYAGLLKEEVSSDIFKNIFNNEKTLNRIIFLESLSKSLGTTGLRIGWLWSLNEKISEELKKNIILKKAGFSKILDEFAVNLLKDNKKIKKLQNNVFDYWSKQREYFHKHIKKNHSLLFNFSSSCNFNNREGIYLLLKARKGLTKEYIFSETGIIGVAIELSDGLYIRYAFGNVDYF